jgi:WD40 repeat protein
MNELAAELPAAGVVRVVGPKEAGAGFLVSASGLIVTCAHVLSGCAPGATVSIEPHVDRRSLPAIVDLLQDPPDVAVLRLTAPVPPDVLVLPLGRSPRTPQPGLRTFGYPQMRPETGLPGELAFYGVTTDVGYDQLALRSEEATLGFSGAPIWDPQLGAVVGMVKSIARADPGQRLGNTAIGVPVETMRDLCPELRLPVGCPYRGLEPFTEKHVDYYYGREHATSQLLTSLAARDFVPVVAVSGGGKSSLLQAGLAKGLRDRPVVGLAQRIRCYQRVSGQPHAGLLHSLAQYGVVLPREVTAAPPQELAAAIRGAVPATELIVVVDQFERLYTDCTDAERKRFVELLRCLATGTVKVVIGLRADFYHLALADLGEQLAAGQVALAPMSEQDLGQAIAAPAAKLLRSFQPGLTQQLVADVRGRPGDLPLLQFALTELWERDAAGGVLTEETYQGLGVELPDGTRLPGAQGALIRRAELLWQDLGLADRLRLQRILFGLIAAQPADTSTASLVVGTRDLSRPARLAQWDEDDQRLIQRLIDARLLTGGRAPAGGQPTVEVSHEALLRAWPRLQSWLKERSKFVQWRAQDLAPNLERWLDSNKNPEFLLPRSLLDPALQWLHDFPDELAGPPASYIQASKRRRTRRRGLLSGAVAVLVVASLAAAGIFYSLRQTAVSQRNQAIYQQTIAEINQLGGEGANSLVAQLNLAAYRMSPTRDLISDLINEENNPLSTLLNGNVGAVYSVAFSPDGRTLAVGGGDDVVRLWDVADRANPQALSHLPGQARSVYSVAFSPDGRTLAAGTYDGTVRLWDVADPAHPQALGQPLTRNTGTVYSVAFSPDDRTLAAGNGNGTVQLWDVANPANPQTLSWLSGPSSAVRSVAFSPDDRTLAIGSNDGTVWWWDVANPANPNQLGERLTGRTSDTGAIWSVAFSPDGHILATGRGDGTIRLWSLPQTILTENTDAVYSVAFSPDSRTLASGSRDGTVRLWDVTNPAHPRALGPPLMIDNSSVHSVAFSPDGRTLVGSTNDGTVRLWNVTDPAHPQALGQPLTDNTGAANSVAFSPDDRTLAVGTYDGTVWLWDVADPAHPQALSHLTGQAGIIHSLAFSPDSRILASGNGDGTVRLWDVANPANPQALGQPLTNNSSVYSVAFSPDGRILASGTYNGTVRLWDVANPANPQALGQPLTPFISPTYSVAFSPDGRTLASGSSGWNVAVYDLSDPLHPLVLGRGLHGHSGSVWSLAFSPDGRTLASGSADGTIRLWNLNVDYAIKWVCAAARNELTSQQWHTYIPELPYQPPCVH